MKKKTKYTKSELSLKIVAIVVTIISAILILFPFVLTLSSSMKDNVKIYDVPPTFFPDGANSLSITLDYSSYAGSDIETQLINDAASVMFGIYTKLPRESIFEIDLYATMNGKTIFHTRAHQIELQMIKDYGVYKGTVIKPKTLLYKDRPQRALDALGYKMDLNGIKKENSKSSLELTSLELVSPILKDSFPINGEISSISMTRKNSLLLESFIHYMKLPKYMYQGNSVISKLGFMTFVLNTVVVIGFAMIAQVILGSICGFTISRLMDRKSGHIAMLYFLGAMMIPFVSIMIPQLILYQRLGAYNNYRALLLPFLYPYGFYVYLFKGFFDKIPGSYFEAAKLDGASSFYLYTKICMPLSKPIISMIALQTFLGNWNDFFWAWLVTEKQNLWTLNVALYNIGNNVGTKQNALMGISIVTILPVIIIALIFSRQLKASVMNSGVKG